MAKLTNNILLAGIVSLITWSWVSYITNWQLLAVLASMATTALYIVLATKSNNKILPTAKLVDSLSIYLATTNSISLIDNMLLYYLYDTTVDCNYIQATKQNTTATVYYHHSITALSADSACSIVQYCQSHSITKLTVIATDIDSLALTVLSYNNIEIAHINMPTLYNQLEYANMLPELHSISTHKKGIVASYALNRYRTKQYAISAIFLVLISSLSYIPIYTLIWASVLACLALYSRFNKRYNKPVSANLEL